MNGDVLQKLANGQNYMFAACIYDAEEQERRVNEIVETSLQEMIDDAKNESTCSGRTCRQTCVSRSDTFFRYSKTTHFV
jgi:hypothetical protein